MIFPRTKDRPREPMLAWNTTKTTDYLQEELRIITIVAQSQIYCNSTYRFISERKYPIRH